MNLVWVTNAKVLDGYNMEFTFNDGKRKSFDFSPFVLNKASLFSKLTDKRDFNNFKLDGWTVTWDDGKIDIAPEYLLENGSNLS